MSEHSIIPPSSAHIWGAPGGCTAWPLMAQQFPDTGEKPEADEGNAAHEVAADLIDLHARASHNIKFAFYFEGRSATNGVPFTEEMFEGAGLYANDVAGVMQKYNIFGGPNFRTEQRVFAPQIHELSDGTPDQSIYVEQENRLFSWDFKFGHEIHEVFEHWQSINYFAGLSNEYPLNDATTVHFRIVQPRAFHRDGPIREWVVKASDLRGYVNTLHKNAAEALGLNAVTRTGRHCHHCSARLNCKAALQAGIGLYEVAIAPVAQTMSLEAMGLQASIVRRALKQLEYLDTAFKEQIEATIRSGKLVPGWGTEQGSGNRAWTKPVEEVVALGDMLGKDLRKAGVKTPTQAIALGVDASVIKAYSNVPRTGLKVVPDNGSKARRVFGATLESK